MGRPSIASSCQDTLRLDGQSEYPVLDVRRPHPAGERLRLTSSDPPCRGPRSALAKCPELGGAGSRPVVRSTPRGGPELGSRVVALITYRGGNMSTPTQLPRMRLLLVAS